MDNKKDKTPNEIPESPLPEAVDWERVANVPKGLENILRSIIENFRMQERLNLYEGASLVGYLQITRTPGAITPIGDEEKIRLVAIDSLGDEGVALEITHSVQVSGDMYTLTFPGLELSIGSTNGSAMITLTNNSVTRSVGVQYTGNDEPQIIVDNLPTADPAVLGALWNNAGTVKVSAG